MARHDGAKDQSSATDQTADKTSSTPLDNPGTAPDQPRKAAPTTAAVSTDGDATGGGGEKKKRPAGDDRSTEERLTEIERRLGILR